MENMTNMDELQHWGIKGMRWGERRYQNKDGTLTPAGKKRYDKEVANLKKETEKVKAAEKIAENKRKTQAKFDRLDAKKQALEERKAALKIGKNKGEEDDAPAETPEQKKARLLKSSDPKELYENRDMLTNNELNDRINRIDMETRLQSKIPAEEQKKSGVDYMNEARTKIEAGTNLFKAVDGAYSAVMNSAMGKTIAKKLGLDVPKEEEHNDSVSDFLKNFSKKSDKEVKDFKDRMDNKRKIEEELARQEKKVADAKAAEEKAEAKVKAEKLKKAQEEVKDWNERNARGDFDKKDTTYSKSGDDIVDNVTYTREKQLPAVIGNTSLAKASKSSSYSSGESYVKKQTAEHKSYDDFAYTKKEKSGKDWIYYYDDVAGANSPELKRGVDYV
jgi:hypothetical protein